ncbi:hypothetical protein OG746_05875 [Streptomyces sp. NBC_01016]|uniref:hypothetical protein n=1 Tax=Streptomyces sp. NBC_01016 TaxID=2903720 RepID=UPI002252376C|nr:hypothetical protein [Streptomyces sp. NBC_01016]MCX4828261.1 hypothetical protein [Streptomyces sp. NBC_01016]
MLSLQQQDDEERSNRLIQDAAHLYYDADDDSETEAFAAWIGNVMRAQIRAEYVGEYPPCGHGYPRRGW